MVFKKIVRSSQITQLRSKKKDVYYQYIWELRSKIIDNCAQAKDDLSIFENWSFNFIKIFESDGSSIQL